ncbi:MAG: tRNA (adenosine(37)-N6)-threonylcarbamoyltransferase complex dimerization subunit type 1 TsaB [Nannocystaceae bacterium]|nr:tRNA (adenosine(37)-N6)-threonylcarbamoyltransferase complex dimerization subunit type 1 TsaB [Nannocystaceae bacterium]
MTDSRLVLTLDASTPRLALALGRLYESGDAEDLEHEYIAGEDAAARGRQASAALSERLSALFTRAGFAPSDLHAVACGVGPGMFTGVRVAIATTKGIALGLRIPAIGVSTLSAVAATPLPETAPEVRLALLDARRSEVYAGVYRVNETGVLALQDDTCGPLETVLKTLQGPAAAVGPGVEPYADVLRAHPAIVLTETLPGPQSEGLWHATQCRWSAREDGAALAAVYLRKSYAELGIHKPKRPFVKSPFAE